MPSIPTVLTGIYPTKDRLIDIKKMLFGGTEPAITTHHLPRLRAPTWALDVIWTFSSKFWVCA